MSEEALLAAASELASAFAQTRRYLSRYYLIASSTEAAPSPSWMSPPPLQFALSYEPCAVAGKLLDVVMAPAETDSDTGNTVHEASAASPMLAVQMDAKAAAKSLHAYLARLGRVCGEGEDAVLRWNTIVRHEQPAERQCAHDQATVSSSSTSVAPTLVVTRQLLTAITPHMSMSAEVCDGVHFLAALLLPGSYDVWNTLRADLQSVSASSSPSSKAVFWEKWFALWVATSLVLSHRFKLQEVWQVRTWLVRLACTHTTHPSSSSVQLHHSLLLDDTVFFFAAAQHAMNYNAWQYRRQCWQACLTDPVDKTSTMETDTRLCDRRAWFRWVCEKTREEQARVSAFVEAHNGDSSATSYLLFLLDTLATIAATTTTNNITTGHGKRARDDAESITMTTMGAAVNALWYTLFAQTQREIRRHADKGHECMWTLRLGLIDGVLSNRHGLARWVRNGWTVREELAWVSAHAGLDEDTAAPSTKPMWLAPVRGATAQHVWTAALTGTPACHAYLAACYGQQLLRLLENSLPIAK